MRKRGNNPFTLIMINEIKKLLKGRTPVILCIGSDKFIFDSLGAIVGQLLVAAGVKAYVYGTLDNPVNALNLKAVHNFIRKRHFGSPILAVDSCIGSDVGKISLCGAIRPASARGVNLGKIGDIGIIAVTSSSMDKSIPLGNVCKMAQKIRDLILETLEPEKTPQKPPVYAMRIPEVLSGSVL